MIDVFIEEIEVQIRKGISNLYLFIGDLEKAWLKAHFERNPPRYKGLPY